MLGGGWGERRDERDERQESGCQRVSLYDGKTVVESRHYRSLYPLLMSGC